MKNYAALFAVLGFAVLSAPAWPAGNCIESCQQAPGAGGVDACATRCSPGGDLDVTHRWSQASYGAIAYGKASGAWGESHNWQSEAKAESVAMQQCAKHGKDCEVMVWFDRKCGAVVSGNDASAFWGLGNDGKEAQSAANASCTKGGGGSCTMQVWQCSN